MAEYIEKGALYEEISKLEEIARNRYLDTPWDSPARTRYQTQLSERTNLKHIIFDLPASDVAPVRHGKWIVNGRLWECSICGETTNNTCMGEPRANYCPNCGAKMDEKEGEQE